MKKDGPSLYSTIASQVPEGGIIEVKAYGKGNVIMVMLWTKTNNREPAVNESFGAGV